MERQALSDVLFALAAAREHRIAGLNRTALQRLLFLSAALYPLVGGVWGYNFSTARFGPFNGAISAAADQLALLGLSSFQDFGVATDGSLRAVYTITHIGLARLEQITKIATQHERFTFITSVVAALDIYGPSVTSKIASREPSYVDMRLRNDVGPILLTKGENKTLELLDHITAALETHSGVSADSVMEKLLLYFDFLSSGLLEAR